MIGKRFLLIGIFLTVSLVLVACGDGTTPADAPSAQDESDAVDTPSDEDEAAQAIDAVSSTTEPTTTTTIFDPFAAILEMTFDTPAELTTSVGAPDFAAGELLVADLEAAGIPLTGTAIWIFRVPESGERILVMDIGQASVLATTTEEVDLVTALSEALSFEDANIDRFVVHYRDATGVLTTTLPMADFLASATQEVDPSVIHFQYVKAGG